MTTLETSKLYVKKADQTYTPSKSSTLRLIVSPRNLHFEAHHEWELQFLNPQTGQWETLAHPGNADLLYNNT